MKCKIYNLESFILDKFKKVINQDKYNIDSLRYVNSTINKKYTYLKRDENKCYMFSNETHSMYIQDDLLKYLIDTYNFKIKKNQKFLLIFKNLIINDHFENEVSIINLFVKEEVNKYFIGFISEIHELDELRIKKFRREHKKLLKRKRRLIKLIQEL